MTSKTKISTFATIAALSLLFLGVTPALAQATQPQTSQQAAFAIQMAVAAQGYANNVVSTGLQHGLNVTQAQSLISQGDQLLSKAQGEASTNSTMAVQDALGAMKDYHLAVQNIMKEAANLFEEAQDAQIARYQDLVSDLQGRVTLAQSVLTKACALQGASSITCTDGQANLAAASANLTQASTILGSQNANLTTVKALISDATQHLTQAGQDISQLITQAKTQIAIDYVQNNLQPRISILQVYAQRANLTSSVMQQVQSLLSSAQTDLNSAVQAFQSGNYNGGVQSAQQGLQQMAQAALLIHQNANH